MRALSAVTDTESDSVKMQWKRVSSESSLCSGNLTNSLNGPWGDDGVDTVAGDNWESSCVFGRIADAILHLTFNGDQWTPCQYKFGRKSWFAHVSVKPGLCNVKKPVTLMLEQNNAWLRKYLPVHNYKICIIYCVYFSGKRSVIRPTHLFLYALKLQNASDILW